MSEGIVKRSVGTHDGSFHADEVTACALLALYNLIDLDKVMRTRDPKVLDLCEYVCDVGGVYEPSIKKFDHHQADYKGSLSSAGMVLKYLHDEKMMSDSEFECLNNQLIIGVDAHDNGHELTPKGVCTYSHLIANFAPIEHQASKALQDKAFAEAMQFALSHMKRLIERLRYILEFREVVKGAMEKGENVLCFEKSIPWMDLFFEMGGESHPALFIIMPSGDGWKLRGIPPNGRERMKVRKDLPAAWAGLSESELQKASGVEGAVFCHKGRFFSLWKTKEDAYKALELTLKEK